jgi:predicted kinase
VPKNTITPKSVKPKIVLLVGLPGSGKSTWVSGKKGVLSSDALRELLTDDPDNQTIHALVFRVLRYLLKQRMTLRRPVTYVDATNLTLKERRPYIALAKSFDAEVEAVFFDIPASECMRRNRLRSRVVPEDAILKMSRKLVAPQKAEGLSRVTVVTASKLQE